MSNSPDASVVITTRNRRDHTLCAIASALAQDCALEVLVYDDASDDDTVDAVRSAFPSVRVFTSTRRNGLIVNRNRGFEDARAPVVVSLDDDAYFSAVDTVSLALDRLRKTPAAAAIALPYIEPLDRRSQSSLSSPFHPKAGETLRSYTGCAHAIIRDQARALGGYRAFFVHQGEERDLCIRLRAAGKSVVFGDGSPVVHLVSPTREPRRISFYGARNTLLYEFFNTPVPDVLWRVPWTTKNTLIYKFSWTSLPPRLSGIAGAVFEAFRRANERDPLHRAEYRAYRRLPTHGPLAWEGDVPPPVGRRADVLQELRE